MLLVCHAELLHHSTPRSSLVLLLCHVELLHHSTPRSSLVLLLCHVELLHHSTPRSSPLYCYYAMPRYCTILPHAPLPCAASMPCRCIAPFYPTLLSLVLLLCHSEVLHHSTSRSSPLCCYYAMSMNCTILPHGPLPCAAIMPCRGIAPFYPTLLSCVAIMACRGIAPFYLTLLSLVLLLCHVDELHHSTSRSSPLCC